MSRYVNGCHGRLCRVDSNKSLLCADAGTCEPVFPDVIKSVGSIMELKTHYIAEVNSSEPSGLGSPSSLNLPASLLGFDCMHGQSECWGNIQQLCARHFYNTSYKWYDFITCQVCC